MKTIKDAVYDAFMIQGVGYKEMSLDDIALEIQDKDSEFKNCNLDELRRKISSFMANATSKIVKGNRVENKDSLYERVKNGKGGYKKGVYRLRRPKKVKTEKKLKPVIEPAKDVQSIKSLYMGSAGEMAVCSEMLFHEFNVSRMSVDDGVDVVAMKNNKTYYIQVKTVQIIKDGFSVKIRRKSYERYNSNDCYYIIVARGNTNQFIIATADDIRRLVENGNANWTEDYVSISFSQSMGKLFVKGECVDYMINSFDRIK